MDDLWIEPDAAKSPGSQCVCVGVCVCDIVAGSWLMLRRIGDFWASYQHSLSLLCAAGERAFPEAAAVQAC